jgi:hypothetical protein
MKRYTSVAQVDKDIDSAHRKIAKAKLVAQEHLDAESLLEGTTDVTELRQHREAADKQFRKIKRLENVRLRKLGEERSRIYTPVFSVPGISPEPNQPPVPQPPPEPVGASGDVTP